jgi:crotonobetainyl-CoA:carnitine CoA-transferase CaiB-like acyl-CoA transferase
VKMSETSPRIYAQAPLMGEHTASVLRDLLHMSDGEIADLTEEGALE